MKTSHAITALLMATSALGGPLSTTSRPSPVDSLKYRDEGDSADGADGILGLVMLVEELIANDRNAWVRTQLFPLRIY